MRIFNAVHAYPYYWALLGIPSGWAPGRSKSVIGGLDGIHCGGVSQDCSGWFRDAKDKGLVDGIYLVFPLESEITER